MKITTSLTQTREIEVPVPSFYKEPSSYEGSSIINVVGILDENTVVNVWHLPNKRISVENSIPESVSHVIAKAIHWDKITEEEFFTHYNNAMESLSLTPKLTEL